jgi:hypothetical protein
MAILTSKEITNFYLFGRITTPQNKVDAGLIRVGNPRDNATTLTIPVDTKDYMASAGRFAIGSQFDLIYKFFDPFLLPLIGSPTTRALMILMAIAKQIFYFGIKLMDKMRFG